MRNLIFRPEQYRATVDTPTPIVDITDFFPRTDGKVLAKFEGAFPNGGSVKDRIAYQMIRDGYNSGQISRSVTKIDEGGARRVVTPGTLLCEGTSGNTGLGLARWGALLGHQVALAIPIKMDESKVAMLRAYGGRVFVVPTEAGHNHPNSYTGVAKRLAYELEGFYTNQHNNPSNARAHEITTGPEIWAQTEGKVTYLVAGQGTGGTITGTARYLRSQNPNVRVIAVDPVGSPVKFMFDYWKEHGQDPPQAEIAKRDGSYKVEGIGMDHHTKNLDFTLLTEVVSIPDEAAFANALNFIDLSGRDVGGSSGAALAAMRQLAPSLGILDVAVVILPDLGNQYLERFMNQEWMKQNGFVGEGQELSIADLVRRKNVPGIVSVSLDDTVERAMYLMEENKFGQLPVTREGDLTYASVTLEGLRNLDLSPLGKRLKLREVVHLDRDVPGYKPFPVLPETGASRKDLEDALFTHPADLIRDENGQITSLLTIADQLELI